jgi:hypothetical protein
MSAWQLRRRWRITLVVIAAGLLALVLLGQLPSSGQWASELGNAAHGPVFSLLTLIVFALLRQIRGRPIRPILDAATAVAIAIALGVATELLQLRMGRDASWGDLGRDTLGALAAGGFLAAAEHGELQPSWRTFARRSNIAVGVVCSVAILMVPAITGIAYVNRYLAFPTLVDFRSPLSSYFLGYWGHVTVARERLPHALTGRPDGDTALHARLRHARHWTVALWEPRPDWRGYESLNLDIVNPTNVPLLLTVWIRDLDQRLSHQAGYRTTIRVPPRARRITPVALSELTAGAGDARVDLARVHSVLLTRFKPNEADEFYVMRLWLD